ncbi:MAG: glutamine amidotransferase family protein [Candidatus Altiarchaeota archaeon]
MENYTKEMSGCGLVGIMSQKKKPIAGEKIMKAISLMSFRSNGLGAGYAAYGIYPEYEDKHAFHMMFDDRDSKTRAEQHLKREYEIVNDEEIPTKETDKIENAPILWRYFLTPKGRVKDEKEYVKETVMEVNGRIKGAFIASSGKNMGVFKGVGYPDDIGEYYRISEYKAHTWTAHARFPTNTSGWWGGAHPFNMLDWTVVHNGEISSYGTNRRYVEGYGYSCTLSTDTEVLAYLIDLLSRKHRLPLDVVAKALAPPFWAQIERMPEPERRLNQMLRLTYPGALINGPFSIIVGHENGMMGLNDRIKLRPLVAGRKNDRVYISSEESAIMEVEPKAEVWYPKAGEPVIFEHR